MLLQPSRFGFSKSKVFQFNLDFLFCFINKETYPNLAGYESGSIWTFVHPLLQNNLCDICIL